MSIVVLQRPSTTIGSNTSKFNAVGNPVLYKFQRRDFVITGRGSSGGNWTFTVSGDVTATFTAGVQFWFVGNTGTNFNSSLLTTVSSVFSAGTTTITASTASTTITPGSGPSTGALNLFSRKNYYLGVDIWVALPSTTFLQTINVTTDIYGTIIADVSSILWAYTTRDANSVFASLVEQDLDIFNVFYIKYTEFWTGSMNSATDDSANQFRSVAGSKQIGNTLYGSNLADYVNFPAAGGNLARWLTPLTRPEIPIGYPWTISVILSETIASTSVHCVFTKNDGTTQNINSANLGLSDGVFRISPNKIYFNSQGVNIPSNMASVTMQLFDIGSGLAISQTITCDCTDVSLLKNVVYLYWRNSLGGDAFGLFHHSQDETYKYSDTIKNKRLTLIANDLTQNEWDAYQEMSTVGMIFQPAIVELLSSTNKNLQRIGQQVYMLDSSANKTGVVVVPQEQSTKTKSGKNILKMVIDLPSIYA